MTRDTVLLVSHSGDFYTIDRVAEALRERGAAPVRVDSDLFPSELSLELRFGTDAAPEVRLGRGELRVDAGQVRGVWLRRLWTPRIDPAVEPAHAQACVREAIAARRAWLTGLAAHPVTWVNPYDAERAAEDKGLQLARAQALGLETPPTLVTNDPQAARAFAAAHPAVIAKMLTPYSTSMRGDTPFVYTSLLRPGDLEALGGLRHCPMVFQARVPAERELRVVVVGERVFAGALDARGLVDWRRSDPSSGIAWQQGHVPEDICDRLRALVRGLGLVYGAVDMIRAPGGRHVFLEVNPAGEWGMLERDLGLPIGAAIADALLEPPT